VSVRRPGEPLGTRCEIKNLNSFRFLERAIEFEVTRQIEIIESGGKIVQETRLYDPDADRTRPMRSKEDAHDYRYFPDPDLLPLEVSQQWIDDIKASMTELPRATRESFVSRGLSQYQASLLAGSKEMADFAKAALSDADASASDLANWLTGPLSARLNEENIDISQSKVSPQQLRGLVKRIADGTISGKIAKEVFDAMWNGEGDADAIVAAKGLQQISDSGEIAKIVERVLEANPQQVADYRGGKQKAFNSLVGQVMKATKGKASPAQVNAVLKQKLENG
jgi:aspartyl-tRNA(Asn)/glutamyl-tRNA(Gln) amidotransferase subunit B